MYQNLKVMGLFFSLILFIGCLVPINKIEINSFSSEKWIADSLACNAYRDTAYKSIINEKNKLLSIDITEVRTFLGQPNYEKINNNGDGVFLYYVEFGPQCGNKDYNKEFLEIKMLKIDFENNSVHNVYAVMP